MIAYSFDDEGFYIGHTKCQKHPFRPGEFLTPGKATLIQPPVCEPGFKAQWNGSQWQVIKMLESTPEESVS